MEIRQEYGPGERFRYVLSRWRFALTVIGCAVVLAFCVSELLPKRYTATSTVIIDPPPTTDSHTATVVNPTYLDSLRTFEPFFTSDTLFQRAVQRFHLKIGGGDLAALKRRVLKVKTVHDTRILEVSATLPDPNLARQLALFITEESIAASREEARAADRDTLGSVNAELDQARLRLEKARTEWEESCQGENIDTLQNEVDEAVTTQSELKRLGTDASAEAAEWRIRERDGDIADRQYAAVQARAASARADEYARQERQVATELTHQRELLAKYSVRRAITGAELDAARKSYEGALGRVHDLSGLTGMRSERMRVIDPGVVPQKPSSPTVLLNTIAAGFLAACFVSAWLGVVAGESRQRAPVLHNARRLA